MSEKNNIKFWLNENSFEHDTTTELLSKHYRRPYNNNNNNNNNLSYVAKRMREFTRVTWTNMGWRQVATNS